MDYSLCILSVVIFIEKRVRESIDLRLLESDTGFSYRHLREVFRECTSMTLARYALSRRVAHAAFDIMHTGKSLTDIAGNMVLRHMIPFLVRFEEKRVYYPAFFVKRT